METNHTTCTAHDRQAKIHDPFTNEWRWACEDCGADCGTAPALELAPVEFVAGQVTSCSSPGDSNCVWTFEVVKRTAKFVTLRDVDTDETMRVGVRWSNFDGQQVETCLPFGRYSLCPVLKADR